MKQEMDVSGILLLYLPTKVLACDFTVYAVFSKSCRNQGVCNCQGVFEPFGYEESNTK